MNIFEWFIDWRFKRKIGKFTKFTFPAIKNMNSDLSIKDLISVQPMQVPEGKHFFTEYYDLSNPRIGQIFDDGDKHPTCGGCCRQRWGKIWTPDGWVYERMDEMTFANAVCTYNPIYKAQVKEERDQWNKENNITEKDVHFPMSYVFDSKKKI